MTLSQQVISLDLAKRLKALGVKQDAHFYWTKATNPATLWCVNAMLEKWPDFTQNDKEFAAFTVAELGEMLPNSTSSFQANLIHPWNKKNQKWAAEVMPGSTFRDDFRRLGQPEMIYGQTEAEARGLMLEYLITNKLMSV